MPTIRVKVADRWFTVEVADPHASPVTAIVEGESVGDVLLYDGRSYRIAEVYDWWGFVKALGVDKPGTA